MPEILKNSENPYNLKKFLKIPKILKISKNPYNPQNFQKSPKSLNCGNFQKFGNTNKKPLILHVFLSPSLILHITQKPHSIDHYESVG